MTAPNNRGDETEAKIGKVCHEPDSILPDAAKGLTKHKVQKVGQLSVRTQEKAPRATAAANVVLQASPQSSPRGKHPNFFKRLDARISFVREEDERDVRCSALTARGNRRSEAARRIKYTVAGNAQRDSSKKNDSSRIVKGPKPDVKRPDAEASPRNARSRNISVMKLATPRVILKLITYLRRVGGRRELLQHCAVASAMQFFIARRREHRIAQATIALKQLLWCEHSCAAGFMMRLTREILARREQKRKRRILGRNTDCTYKTYQSHGSPLAARAPAGTTGRRFTTMKVSSPGSPEHSLHESPPMPASDRGELKQALRSSSPAPQGAHSELEATCKRDIRPDDRIRFISAFAGFNSLGYTQTGRGPSWRRMSTRPQKGVHENQPAKIPLLEWTKSSSNQSEKRKSGATGSLSQTESEDQSERKKSYGAGCMGEAEREDQSERNKFSRRISQNSVSAGDGDSPQDIKVTEKGSDLPLHGIAESRLSRNANVGQQHSLLNEFHRWKVKFFDPNVAYNRIIASNDRVIPLMLYILHSKSNMSDEELEIARGGVWLKSTKEDAKHCKLFPKLEAMLLKHPAIRRLRCEVEQEKRASQKVPWKAKLFTNCNYFEQQESSKGDRIECIIRGRGDRQRNKMAEMGGTFIVGGVKYDDGALVVRHSESGAWPSRIVIPKVPMPPQRPNEMAVARKPPEVLCSRRQTLVSNTHAVTQRKIHTALKKKTPKNAAMIDDMERLFVALDTATEKCSVATAEKEEQRFETEMNDDEDDVAANRRQQRWWVTAIETLDDMREAIVSDHVTRGRAGMVGVTSGWQSGYRDDPMTSNEITRELRYWRSLR